MNETEIDLLLLLDDLKRANKHKDGEEAAQAAVLDGFKAELELPDRIKTFDDLLSFIKITPINYWFLESLPPYLLFLCHRLHCIYFPIIAPTPNDYALGHAARDARDRAISQLSKESGEYV